VQVDNQPHYPIYLREMNDLFKYPYPAKYPSKRGRIKVHGAMSWVTGKIKILMSGPQEQSANDLNSKKNTVKIPIAMYTEIKST